MTVCRSDIVETTLVPHTAFANALRRLEQCFEHAECGHEPSCIAIIGESRTGKTRVLEECLAKHPPVRNPEGLNVPILYVKTPSTPTVKGLAEAMLDAMHDPRSASGTENQKTKRLMHLTREANTKGIMVEEFQHFVDRTSHRVRHSVADWLKILVDELRISLFVSGLESCRAVLMQNEQLAGRFFAPVIMPRFLWTDEDHREEFVAILEAFYTVLVRHLELPALHSDEMAFRIYCATGGLMGYLTKLLRQAVWNAIDKDSKKIDLEDFFRAHREAVWAEESSDSLPSPFARKFSLTPNEELLRRIQAIGTRTAVPVRTPRRSGRKQIISTLVAS